jgi:lysophospholipase
MLVTDPSAAPTAVPSEVATTYRPADRYGFIDGAGGRLRVAIWNASGTARGSVVLLGGRGEFVEKYATEVVSELLSRGFAVLSMDWRGQGLSSRLLADQDKGHIDDFATYVADLKLFFDTVLEPATPRPVIALAHSMGGHIVLRAIAEHGPGPLAAAMLVSPMIGLTREVLLRRVLAIVPKVRCLDERYLFGSGPYVTVSRSFAINDLTHDERHFRFTDQWFSADPRLALGGVTIGWARQALRSMHRAHTAGYFEHIPLPIMLLSGSEDTVVDIASHEAVAARLAHVEWVLLRGARHEIMMETDPIRALFWQAFDRLAKDTTHQASLPPALPGHTMIER